MHLELPDFSKQFMIQMEAAGTGIGAQNDHPI